MKLQKKTKTGKYLICKNGNSYVAVNIEFAIDASMQLRFFNSFLSLEVPESNNQKMEDYIFDLMLFSSAFRLRLKWEIPVLCTICSPYQCHQFFADRNKSEISFVRLFQIPGFDNEYEVKYITNFFFCCVTLVCCCYLALHCN